MSAVRTAVRYGAPVGLKPLETKGGIPVNSATSRSHTPRARCHRHRSGHPWFWVWYFLRHRRRSSSHRRAYSPPAIRS
ncbi:MAG: hypothetical protein K6U14_03290 [Firmicutes bacterium]|nr:hypothetical protein [Alicyclobacillaceae bacterium]MCL6496643.1 hypothetical protein [Bacillota bacterium]